MAFTYKSIRSITPNARPKHGVHQYGELYINAAEGQIGFIDPQTDPQDLLPITYFLITADYKIGDHIYHDGHLYSAIKDVAHGSPFNPDDWKPIAGSLSIEDYDPAAAYAKGDVIFHQYQFWSALADIPAPAGPFDESKWEGLQATFSSNVLVGDILTTFHMLTPQEQHDLRRLLLWGQEIPKNGDYSDLFALWGNHFGAPKDPNNFVVPDMRGRAIRGADESLTTDLTAQSRFALSPGTMANIGAMSGTYQDDAVGKHRHNFYLWKHENDATGGGHGYVTHNNRWPFRPRQVTLDAGAAETVMKNISVHWYVKY